MRWALIHTNNQLHYWKLDQDNFTVELKYNPQAHSFRLTAGEKRLFFIEKAGFLQNKYLLRTEYSVITGEVYPVKNWHSGIVSIDNKKINYFLKENLLVLSSKKEKISLTIELDDAEKLNQSELCALLFSTLRVLTKSNAAKEKLAIA
jgi:hypothetical protein